MNNEWTSSLWFGKWKHLAGVGRETMPNGYWYPVIMANGVVKWIWIEQKAP